MEEEVASRRVFGVADYIVFGGLILVSVAIGIYFAIKDKKINTSLNYFLGGRKLTAVPLGLSFVVTFQSSIMMLGSPAEVYVYGLQYAVQVIGVLAAYHLAAVIVVPLFHPLNVTSVYEYYQLRYGTNYVRYLGVILGISYYTLYMGVVLFGTALALESTAGVPLWLSITTFALAATLYTSLGGIKAVIWTDVFQSIVMFSGILAVIIKSTLSAGGPSKVGQIGAERLNLFNFDPDPTIRHTFWTLVFGSIPQFFYPAITQAGIQRIMSTSHSSVSKRMLYIAAPLYCIVWTVVMFEGLSVFAYHSLKGCDPLASGQIRNSNQIIPFTILDMFHDIHGMPGLFIAALAAASLSTISSGLSGLAAVTCVDILKVCKPNISDQKATNISKLFVVMYGVISMACAFFLSSVKGPLGEVMAGFTGAVAGPETGMFLVSAFFRRSRPKAVFFATIVGLALNLWMIFGQTFSPDIARAPYLPPGPVDKCPSFTNGSFSIPFESGHNGLMLDNFTAIAITTTVGYTNISLTSKNKTTTGLTAFYSISYMYFHLIGTVATVVVAVIGSLVISQSRPQEVPSINENCILPFSILIPKIFRKWCRSRKQAETE